MIKPSRKVIAIRNSIQKKLVIYSNTEQCVVTDSNTVDGINPAPTSATTNAGGVSWHTPRPPHFNIVAAPTPGSPVQDFRESTPTHGWHPYTLSNINDRGCGGVSCVVKLMQDCFYIKCMFGLTLTRRGGKVMVYSTHGKLVVSKSQH